MLHTTSCTKARGRTAQQSALQCGLARRFGGQAQLEFVPKSLWHWHIVTRTLSQKKVGYESYSYNHSTRFIRPLSVCYTYTCQCGDQLLPGTVRTVGIAGHVGAHPAQSLVAINFHISTRCLKQSRFSMISL